MGRVLMSDILVFLGNVGFRERCDCRTLIENENMHVVLSQGVGRGLTAVRLKVLQKLGLAGPLPLGLKLM